MKIAAAAYPIDWHETWESYGNKLASWVSEAAGQGADLLVFPEYGAMELASLAGMSVASDLKGSMRAASKLMDRANGLMSELSQDHGVYVLGPSGPVYDPAFDRPVNRAHFFCPNGSVTPHDKQVMTRWERDPMGVDAGLPLVLMETNLGKIGVLICYDSEFPALGRALVDAGAEIILTPSATEAMSGYTRVRIGSMARALEGQCIVVHAPTQGDVSWNQVVDENTGAAAIYGPPDKGFLPNGIVAEGRFDRPGWTYADVDINLLRTARADGEVLTLAHQPESDLRARSITKRDLR